MRERCDKLQLQASRDRETGGICGPNPQSLTLKYAACSPQSSEMDGGMLEGRDLPLACGSVGRRNVSGVNAGGHAWHRLPRAQSVAGRSLACRQNLHDGCLVGWGWPVLISGYRWYLVATRFATTSAGTLRPFRAARILSF